jgi:hypothetical protein
MSDFRRQVIAAVGNLPDNGEPVEELVDGCFGLLAAALSKMDPAERETILDYIEAGSLRRAVAKFPGAQPGLPRIPGVPNASQH